MTSDTSPVNSNATDEEQQDARATSFGAFKPVGHVVIGVPDRQTLRKLRAALTGPGTPGLPVDELAPKESVEEMQGLIDNASPLAGFGYEITLMRRYLKLASAGTSWLIVKAESDEDAQFVSDVARQHGASLAVRYGDKRSFL